jgi:hypothetical protein
MLRQCISHDSRVADELYINRMLLALEDFLVFSLHSFTCIAKQFTTLNSSDSCLVSISLIRTLSALFLVCDITFESPRSPTSEPAHYTRTSPINIVCDIECAYIPGQGESIVLNPVQFLVGCT